MNLPDKKDFVKRIFICCAYLYSNDRDKIYAAKTAYEKSDRTQFHEAWAVADYIESENTADNLKIPDLKVRVLKGGSYKIKDYYLENYSLSDIRGASNLLTYVEETVIPDIISENFIRETIIYNGGGNIFALLPSDTADSFAYELEKTAQEYLISAATAYILSAEMSIKDIFGPMYRETMYAVENLLDNRKKVKIINSVNLQSNMLGKEIMPGISVEADVCTENSVCEACRVRTAQYTEKNGINKRCVCAGCLHKAEVGRKVRSAYIDEYRRYTGTDAAKIKTLEELGEKIAVVYGDGNNMGGIIQNFVKITDMMEFSENVKLVANESVFSSMGELGIDKFEVVGLGGDDVFMIVPANRAVEFAVKLAKKYKEKFEELYGSRHFKGALSTMSVGIAVGRYDIPVKILLEQAEIKLDEAKSYSKKRTDQDDGSVSFAMHTDYDNSLTVKSVGGMTDTMKPYSIENAEKLLGFICELKTNKISKARLRNILDAYRNAESIEESDLFFEYVNAKEASLNKRIRLCPMNGYELSGGHYTKDGKLFYIWKDILELYE